MVLCNLRPDGNPVLDIADLDLSSQWSAYHINRRPIDCGQRQIRREVSDGPGIDQRPWEQAYNSPKHIKVIPGCIVQSSRRESIDYGVVKLLGLIDDAGLYSPQNSIPGEDLQRSSACQRLKILAVDVKFAGHQITVISMFVSRNRGN
ncbi:hypothetical protein D3C75_1009680 [compost metagenome]